MARKTSRAIRQLAGTDCRRPSARSASTISAAGSGSRLRHYGEIAGIFVLVAAVYLLLRRFDLLQGGLAVSDHLTYGLVFFIGLAASVSTCMAVTGGLLLAAAAKYDSVSATTAPATKFKLHLYFNAGRLIGYGVLGGVIGALGSALAFSAEVNGVLMLAASVVMVVIGLQLVGLLPSFGLARVVPAAWLEWMRSNSARQSGPAAFLLGASTFFFPCGFTQALQLYVLSQASATAGALTMLIFALGHLAGLAVAVGNHKLRAGRDPALSSEIRRGVADPAVARQHSVWPAADGPRDIAAGTNGKSRARPRSLVELRPPA